MSYSPGQYPAAGQWPAATGTPTAAAAKVRPGRAWYLAALALVLGGAAWLIVGFVSLGSQVNSFQRVALPTSGSPVSLSHTGSYVVYYEAPGAASNPLPRFQLRIVPDSAGAALSSLTPYGSSVTYSFGSREGRAALTLQVSGAGRFLVIAPGAPRVAGGSYLAFGSGIAGSIVGAVAPAIPAIILGVLGIIVIFIVRKRQILRLRAMAAPAYFGGPAGQPYPGGQAGPTYPAGPRAAPYPGGAQYPGGPGGPQYPG
jgi:hypothetical protein